jgi:HSP20 family protein
MNTLTSYSPVRDFGLFPSRLSSLADVLFGTGRGEEGKSWSPAVNVTEDEHNYRISADLPDVPSGDVKVVVRDGVLTVRGERKEEKKTDGTKYHLVERSYGSFQRSFTLPKDANGEKVSAEFKNGVLLVTVPKREEVKPREIEVKVQ